MLKASGMNMTPEVYQAYALVKSGAVLLGAIPCMFLFPLLVPVVVVLALLLYFKENQKADETLKAKREEIEGELPRMVATMEQELKASRNVIGMLERFKGNAGPALTGELDILLADMRSSNYEEMCIRDRYRQCFFSRCLLRFLPGIFGTGLFRTDSRQGLPCFPF